MDGARYVSLRWALIARGAAVAALLLGLLAGLVPVEGAATVVVILTLLATAALFTAAAAVLIGMRRPARPEHAAARRSAMTVAIVAAVVALPMIYLANQRVLDHLKQSRTQGRSQRSEDRGQMSKARRASGICNFKFEISDA